MTLRTFRKGNVFCSACKNVLKNTNPSFTLYLIFANGITHFLFSGHFVNRCSRLKRTRQAIRPSDKISIKGGSSNTAVREMLRPKNYLHKNQRRMYVRMAKGAHIRAIRMPVVILSQMPFHFLEWKKVTILLMKLSLLFTFVFSLFIS